MYVIHKLESLEVKLTDPAPHQLFCLKHAAAHELLAVCEYMLLQLSTSA